VLKLLASQAAISLENTYLYRDLAEREGKIRRLVDANIIGIIIWNLEGQIQEANQAFLQMVGYDREDVASGRVRWTDLTPEEWRDRDTRALAELAQTGTALPSEKEYIRKDGSRVPVLIGAATFDERRDLGVAFVVDLTERKRAEADMRDSERRYREVQLELTHANRVATMGQLTASIAHEVNHPIGATLMNAETALRWLAAQPPNLDKATQAIERIVKDGKRAAGIVDRIRDLVKKAPARKDKLEINEAILEVIGLTRSEISKHGVSLQMQLAKDLPLIQGDRVQLQQVILNLIVNAVEAMSQTGEYPRELLIGTEMGPESVRIAVQDSGPGLPQAGSERAFEAFYTTKPSGLGMGLSICRSIVEAHGGRLWTTPNEPRGAVFCFTLPIEQKSFGAST
jgi:PAS domain S-box-containing protein